MDRLIIEGGNPLRGEVKVSGAKNAALPILMATLLTDAPVRIHNVPHLQDVTSIMELLGCMGVKFTMHEDMSIETEASQVNSFCVPRDLVKALRASRASIFALGPLLSRYGQAKICLPGGCAIGSRPVDMHLQAMRSMGADIKVEDGYICASIKGRLQGIETSLDKITVTGTENIMMAAVLAKGKTVVHNAAREPEVEDLGHFLNELGAKISGVGTSTIMIEGVKQLTGGAYTILADRIEAGTYLAAATLTQGSITVNGISPCFLSAILKKLSEAGAVITTGDNTITLDMQGKRPRAVDVSTAPYPAFPTDMQAPMMAINALADGVGQVTEDVFENRFMHVQGMQKLGADIQVNGNVAVCKGKKKLRGAHIVATDLRASASLVLAALMAEGETVIDHVYYIDRGYEHIEEKLRQLGARIRRVNSNEVADMHRTAKVSATSNTESNL